MGRNTEDFQGQVYFHGSAHPFNVGDTVEPRQHWKSTVAYASPHEHTAKIFAKRQGGGHVVSVEPIDRDEQLPALPVKGIPGGKEVISTKGFKVTGVVGHYAPDGKTYHKNSQESCNSKLCK